MARKAVVIGASMLVCLNLAAFVSLNLLAMLGGITVIASLLVFLLFRSRQTGKTVLIVLTTLLVCFVLYGTREAFVRLPALKYDSLEVELKGQVYEQPVRNAAGYDTVLLVSSVNGNKEHFKVRLYYYQATDWELADHLLLKVKLKKPPDDSVFSASSLKADGIFLTGTLTKELAKQPTDTFSLLKFRYGIQNTIKQKINAFLPSEEGAVLTGMLLGDKQSISEQTTADFRRSGISHILVVSGLHVAIVTELFAALFVFLGLSRKKALLFSLIPMMGFLILTGFGPSAMRAEIMMGIYIVAYCLGKQSDSLSSLFTAVIFLGLWNPYLLNAPSLLLSIFSVLGILCVGIPIQGWLFKKFAEKKLLHIILCRIGALGAVSFGAALFTSALSSLFFGQVALMGTFTNLIILPILPIIVFLAMVFLALGFVFPPNLAEILSLPFYSVCRFLLGMILSAAHWIGSFPFAVWNTDRLFVVFMLAGVTILLWIGIASKNKRKLVLSVVLSTVLVIGSFGSYAALFTGCSEVSMIASRNARVFVLRDKGKTIVYGPYGDDSVSRLLKEYLLGMGVHEIDLILLPEGEGIFSSGLIRHLRDFKVKQIVTEITPTLQQQLPQMFNADTKLLPSGAQTIVLSKESQVELFRENENAYGVRIKLGDTKIRILQSPRGVAEEGEKGYQAMFFVKEGLSDFLKSDTLIGVTDKLSDTGTLSLSGRRLYETGEFAVCTLLTRKRGDITVRSEGMG